jgi:hypothetical protein
VKITLEGRNEHAPFNTNEFEVFTVSTSRGVFHFKMDSYNYISKNCYDQDLPQQDRKWVLTGSTQQTIIFDTNDCISHEDMRHLFKVKDGKDEATRD